MASARPSVVGRPGFGKSSGPGGEIIATTHLPPLSLIGSHVLLISLFPFLPQHHHHFPYLLTIVIPFEVILAEACTPGFTGCL
jgi:hypothetical protein